MLYPPLLIYNNILIHYASHLVNSHRPTVKVSDHTTLHGLHACMQYSNELLSWRSWADTTKMPPCCRTSQSALYCA